MALRSGLVVFGLLRACGGVALDDAEGLLQTSAQPRDVTLADAVEGMLSAAFDQVDRSVALLDLGSEQLKPKGPKGVRFSRNFTTIEGGSSFLMEMSNNQATWADDDPSSFTCQEHDKWGDNNCKFEFGSSMHIKVAAKIGKPINEGSRIIIDIPRPWAPKGTLAATFISRVKPIHVECPACSNSGNCTVTYMDHSIDLKIPTCPIPAGETTFVDKAFPLPKIPIPGNNQGQLTMNMLGIREDGSTLGDVTLQFGMGPLDSEASPAQEAAELESKHADKKKHHHHR